MQGEGPRCFARWRGLQRRGVSSPTGKGGTLRQGRREGSEPCTGFLGLEGPPHLAVDPPRASLGHTLQLRLLFLSGKKCFVAPDRRPRTEGMMLTILCPRGQSLIPAQQLQNKAYQKRTKRNQTKVPPPKPNRTKPQRKETQAHSDKMIMQM